MTLIEVIVVISVLGVVMTLLMSATAQVRHKASQVQCQNNLRQMSLSVNLYMDVHGMIPRATNYNGYSAHVFLLPHLELSNLFSAINFNVSAHDNLVGSANSTVNQYNISVFTCPSDYSSGSTSDFQLSYPGSRGVEFRDYRDNGAFAYWSKNGVSSAQFLDGASNTICFSEWRISKSITESNEKSSNVYNLGLEYSGRAKMKDFELRCSNITNSTEVELLNMKGKNWLAGDYVSSFYNNNLTPGNPSCLSGGLIQEGAYTAGSWHNQAVNCAMVDGQVRLIRYSIDSKIWRALGTRGESD